MLYAVCSVFGLNEAVLPIAAAVYHADGLCISIPEHKEVMIEEVHLHDGFLHIHRTHVELLFLDNRELVFLVRDCRSKRSSGKGMKC